MDKFNLWQETPGYKPEYGQEAPGLAAYVPQGAKGAVVVFPGGGYNHLAAHEGEPVAQWLNTLGVAAFVLNYRVKPYGHPYPWMDATRAVRTVRARAAQWGFAPDKIAVLGFSAGGHLAATISTRHDAGAPASDDPIERVSSRPDAAVICYGVTTFDTRYYHGGSARALFGDSPSEQDLQDYSAEKQVTQRTPPAFLWHTADDASVPLMNSLLYAGALQACGVAVELHVFPHGRHGLGLANDDPVVGQWKGLCATWLQNMGWC